MRKRAHVGAVIFAALSWLAVAPSGADSIELPQSRDDSAWSAARFDDRAKTIIRFNACGRDHDFMSLRAAQAAGNHKEDGEGLGQILIAKLAFLTDPRFANEEDCVYERRLANTPGVVEAWLNATPNCAATASTTLVLPDRIDIRFKVDRGCLRRQVNEAVMAMRKTGQMGTPTPCFEGFITLQNPLTPEGDFDVNVRELTRILYMGTRPGFEVLERETFDHMFEHLLAARGPLADEDYPIVADCVEPAGDDVGSIEDFADRESWYNEILSTIGDILKWLLRLYIRAPASALATATGIGAAPFMMGEGEDPLPFMLPHFDRQFPETENHRLMIEGSKYLINAVIIQELEKMGHDNVDEIREYQDEVREWLLKEMQRITIHDFQEYNARPYTRYSLNAILNLHDFAEFGPMPTAAQIVLDLSAAKFAAGSNRGRRVAPFRRLSEYDGSGPDEQPHLYEKNEGSDHEVARALVLAGQTQLLGDRIDPKIGGSLIYPAVSPYRMPNPVLQVATERKKPFTQTIRHSAVEGYAAFPSFTMSIGGIRQKAALDFYGIERAKDRGVAMPTVLIPTLRGIKMQDVFQLAGPGATHVRPDNLCGYKGFVCGLQPELPPVWRDCIADSSVTTGESFFFYNSAKCDNASSPHFYLAVKRVPCPGTFCDPGLIYAVMEMVDAPTAQQGNDPAFAAFKIGRRAALGNTGLDATGTGTYRNADGELITYQVSSTRSRIISVNGTPQDPFQTGGAILKPDGNGKVTIASPWSFDKVEIDFTNWADPKRVTFP